MKIKDIEIKILDHYLDRLVDEDPMVAPYLRMYDRRPGEIEREGKCLYELLEIVRAGAVPVIGIFELFGGMGLFYQISRAMLGRRLPFQSMELSPLMYDYLLELTMTDPYYQVHHRDAIDTDFFPPATFNLIAADFNFFTLLKYARDRVLRERVNALFDSEADYFILTDVACGKFHLNKKTYEKEFGFKMETLADYYQAVSVTIAVPRGWRLLATSTHTNAGYLLFCR